MFICKIAPRISLTMRNINCFKTKEIAKEIYAARQATKAAKEKKSAKEKK